MKWLHLRLPNLILGFINGCTLIWHYEKIIFSLSLSLSLSLFLSLSLPPSLTHTISFSIHLQLTESIHARLISYLISGHQDFHLQSQQGWRENTTQNHQVSVFFKATCFAAIIYMCISFTFLQLCKMPTYT